MVMILDFSERQENLFHLVLSDRWVRAWLLVG